MSMVVDVVARSSAVLLIGLVMAAGLRHRSAALRHAVLAAAVLGAALIVPATLQRPSWEVRVPVPSAAATAGTRLVEPPHAAAAVAAAEETRTVRWGSGWALFAFWAAGFLVSAVPRAGGLLRLVRLTARARPVSDDGWNAALRRVAGAYDLPRAVALLQTDRVDVLATWGVGRPKVLIPAHAVEWAEQRQLAVLSHELAHIRRHDWLVQSIVEAITTVYWFNPLMWIARRRLRRESERAADDLVLAQGVPPREYAGHLLEIARSARRPGPKWASTASMARPPELEERIAAMLSTRLERTQPSRRAIVAAAALVAAVSLALPVLRAGQVDPQPLTGIVYDASGAVLPDVLITVEGAGGAQGHTRTGPDGRFEFPPLRPGRYGFDVKLAGFRSLRQDIELHRERDFDRAITLQVGELTETIHVEASRIPPADGASAEEPRRVRVGGNIRVPKKVRDISPVYPEPMRAAGLQGVVPVDAVIGVDGTVQAARVLGAHVHPDFAAAALEAVRGWLFTPTLLNGEPVEVRMTVTITFQLAD